MPVRRKRFDVTVRQWDGAEWERTREPYTIDLECMLTQLIEPVGGLSRECLNLSIGLPSLQSEVDSVSWLSSKRTSATLSGRSSTLDLSSSQDGCGQSAVR